MFFCPAAFIGLHDSGRMEGRCASGSNAHLRAVQMIVRAARCKVTRSCHPRWRRVLVYTWRWASTMPLVLILLHVAAPLSTSGRTSRRSLWKRRANTLYRRNLRSAGPFSSACKSQPHLGSTRRTIYILGGRRRRYSMAALSVASDEMLRAIVTNRDTHMWKAGEVAAAFGERKIVPWLRSPAHPNLVRPPGPPPPHGLLWRHRRTHRRGAPPRPRRRWCVLSLCCPGHVFDTEIGKETSVVAASVVKA